MEIRAFTKSYEGKTVFRTEGLTLKKDRIYAVIGANGSGKSTFGKILAGIISSDQGSRVLEDGCSVCYMPQKSYAFRMSTFKNVMLGGTDQELAEEYLRFLEMLPLKDRRGDRLSGGETARMALARSLMRPCDLVILDEPTAAMDVASALKAEELILKYREKYRCTVILISHNLKQVRRLADEVIYLHQGVMEEMGQTAKVLDDPSKETTKRFMDYTV